MASEQLPEYIKLEKQTGKSKEQITALLLASGSTQEEIDRAFAEIDATPVVPVPPPPAPPVQTKPKTDFPSLNTLFSDSFDLMKKRIWVMLATTLILIGMIAATGFIAAFVIAIFAAIHSAAIFVILGTIFAIIFFLCFIYAIFWVSTSYVVALRDTAENTGVVENLKRSRQFVWSLILVSVLTTLINIGGFILFIIPGIILSTYYGLAVFSLIIDGKGGRAALAQSKAYVAGRWWKVFGRSLLVNLIYIGFYLPFSIISKSNFNIIIVILGTICLFTVQVLYAFYSTAFSFTLYRQLKETAIEPNAEKYKGGVTGWTIWGIIGSVIALIMIPILLSVLLVSISFAREKARDAQRLSDVSSIQADLESYYIVHNAYPNSLNDLSQTSAKIIPTAPATDGDCTPTQNTYTYVPNQTRSDYRLGFCLGEDMNGYLAGPHVVSYEGVDLSTSTSATQNTQMQ